MLTQLGADPALLAAAIAQATAVGEIGLAFFALFGVLFALRGRLAADAARAPTWGCGYVAPTPRMQYSAESFAGPLLSVLRAGFDISASGAIADKLENSGYRRALSWIARKSADVRALHRPSLHQYLVYVFVALVVLMSYAARLVRP